MGDVSVFVFRGLGCAKVVADLGYMAAMVLLVSFVPA